MAMTEIPLMMPGYSINEYKIVLDPHPELSHKISRIRQDFASEYKASGYAGAKANLVIARFSQLTMKETRIVNQLERIALGYPPFKVELKDFGSYPSHSIFINITSKLPLQQLIKLIRSEMQQQMKFDEDHKPYFILEPNMMIASKLKPWQYEKAWLAYANKHFTGRFIADAMLLLKRPEGETTWQIVKRLEFQNLPVNTKQGQLF